MLGTLPEHAETLHITSVGRCARNEGHATFDEFYRRDQAFILQVLDSSARREGRNAIGKPVEVFPLREIGTEIELHGLDLQHR